MSQTQISIQTDDFDVAALHDWLVPEDASVGAVITFTGLVRDQTSAGFSGLFLEHYPGMTERALESIVQKARNKWDLNNVVIIHRIGQLGLADNIVFVGVASPHRSEGFEAAQFMMDYLKKDAPFWKKEIGAQANWVEQKASDLEKAERWK